MRVFDVLVIGAGPAGLSMAATLAAQGLTVAGLAIATPNTPWRNTYGIWLDELEAPGLSEILSHRWESGLAYFDPEGIPLKRTYGLIDRQQLQDRWLDAPVQWFQGIASHLEHQPHYSCITTNTGETLAARLIVDASGHNAAFVKRKPTPNLAYQAAYGIVGRFSKPPISHAPFVLMDYRSDHLDPEQRATPTFLYAMDLGDGTYFVEETSLAASPAVSFANLEQRLHQRLRAQGVEIQEVHHIEHCLFPMNAALPDLGQPLFAFGGAASMVHPASGYMMGALLRRGPGVAVAIANALAPDNTNPQAVAHTAWQALWPPERLRKHYLYLFGLACLMRFPEPRLRHFFQAFFSLPTSAWSGFLADTLSFPEMLRTMLKLFADAPNDVRWGLMSSVFPHGDLLGRAFSFEKVSA